jgi:uncharacterized protein YgiM (DUF1202 family)
MNILRICSSVFLILGLSALGYADEHFPFLAQVSKKAVNVRAGANTNFEQIAKLNEGDTVVVLARSFDWYKIQLPTTAKSYLRADYLKIGSNGKSELVGDNVNIRAVANSDSSSLGVLKKGDLVKVIKQTNGWWQIEPPAQASGWVRQDFLSVKSLTVDAAFIRSPIRAEVVEKTQKNSLAATDVKGQLVPLAEPKADMRYKLLINGQTAYYVQNVPHMERFKGAIVLIKGVIVADNRYDYPVLRVINISLLF